MNILERLVSTAANKILAWTENIYDKTSEQYQDKINAEFININTRFKTNNNFTLATAIARVPTDERCVGMTVTFKEADGKWSNWQFIGTAYDNPSIWENIANWQPFGADIVNEKGDSVLKVMSQSAVTANFNELNQWREDIDTELGLEDNPEFIRVILDADDHFLFGIRTDGTVEWSKGIPSPIAEVLDSVKSDIYNIVNGGNTNAIENLTEVLNFLSGVTDDQSFDEIHKDIEARVKAIDQIRGLFKGKVSIIGDSISTFDADGYKTAGYAMYYPHTGNDVTTVNDTYWMKVINSTLGASLEVNASYSGSCAVRHTQGTDGLLDRVGLYPRTSMLGNPDTIVIALGTNDSGSNATINGQYNYDADLGDLNEDIFNDAYIKGIKSLMNNYPGVSIVSLMHVGIGEAYKTVIRTICSHYGIACLDLSKAAVFEGHPNKEGMTYIADQINRAYVDHENQLRSLAMASPIVCENPEYLTVTLDKENKIIDGIKTDGTHYFATNIDHNGVVNEITDNPEYIRAYVDADNRFLWGIKEDGSIEWAKGVPTPVTEAMKINNIELYFNTKTGKLSVFSEALNSSFTGGSIDRVTGKVTMNFNFREH